MAAPNALTIDRNNPIASIETDARQFCLGIGFLDCFGLVIMLSLQVGYERFAEQTAGILTEHSFSLVLTSPYRRGNFSEARHRFP